MFQKQLVALRMNCMKKTSLEKIKAMMNKIKFPNLFAVFLVVVSHFVFFFVNWWTENVRPKGFRRCKHGVDDIRGALDYDCRYSYPKAQTECGSGFCANFTRWNYNLFCLWTLARVQE
ncbi:hypothetical protein DA792_13375 [Celeribacter baekdonensis]|uniref:Uncharacterized protein n=1 Tax=Celeribacter baekdonensis TaxID=875171 RepID=A0A2R4M461_9RHOB|nr:hypothetical protein DA792_13375 [Celeribacter baekdonensis]